MLRIRGYGSSWSLRSVQRCNNILKYGRYYYPVHALYWVSTLLTPPPPYQSCCSQSQGQKYLFWLRQGMSGNFLKIRLFEKVKQKFFFRNVFNLILFDLIFFSRYSHIFSLTFLFISPGTHNTHFLKIFKTLWKLTFTLGNFETH